MERYYEPEACAPAITRQRLLTNAIRGHRQTLHRATFKRTHDLRPSTTSHLNKSCSLSTIPFRLHMSSFASVDSILGTIVVVKIDFLSTSRDSSSHMTAITHLLKLASHLNVHGHLITGQQFLAI